MTNPNTKKPYRYPPKRKKLLTKATVLRIWAKEMERINKAYEIINFKHNENR